MEDTGSTPTTTIGDASASLALADSSFATPAAETPATESTAPAAITQAVDETPAPESASPEEKPKGEPPTWRWQDILANARTEHDKLGYERAKAEYEQQYGGFSQLSPEERSGLLVWNRALNGDPGALAQVSQINPALAQALGHRGQPQAQPEPQPDAAIQLQDGSTVPVFTPDGMKKWQQWNQQQLQSHFAKEFQPIVQTAEQLRAQQEQAALQKQHEQWAGRVLTRFSKQPFFEEFKPGIQKALSQVPANFQGDLEDVIAESYAAQLNAKLTSLPKEAESKVLANLQQRAAAGTPNPSTASTASPQPTLGNARAALEWANKQTGAA